MGPKTLGRSLSIQKAASNEEEKAMVHLSQIRFHQSFMLPANPANGRLRPMRVTYADCDYRTAGTTMTAKNAPELDVAGPTLLNIAGMYGGRYVATGSTDALARKHGLRLIVVDKFGLGGTGEVPLEQRVKGFLDLVPALLEHLNVEHVALMCHSAGTIYMLNIIICLRHILHPRNPYVCFLAPWVHTSHSGSLGALNLVPTSVISHSNGIVKFLNQNLSPVFNFSTGVSSGISTGVSSGISSGISPGISAGTGSGTSFARADSNSLVDLSSAEIRTSVDEAHEDSEEDSYDENLDFSPNEGTGEVYWKTLTRYLFAENTTGGADEALLCLKRGPNTSWGLINDYDDAVARILQREVEATQKERRPSKGNAGATGKIGAVKELSMSKSSLKPFDQCGILRVQVFFAENDLFIAEKGKTWFDGLWRKEDILQRELLYESEIVKDSTHDSIGDLKNGVLDRVFADVRNTWIL